MTDTFVDAFYEACVHAEKKPWVLTQPLVEIIAIVQPASVQIWIIRQLGRDTLMYPLA